MNPLVLAWLIRSAYGLEQSECNDACSILCCFPCFANQIYQTSLSRGNPSIDGGKQFNVNVLEKTTPSSYLCYTFCCTSCMIRDTLNKYLNMPDWMGCCCVNVCAATSILSYHYRLKSKGCGLCNTCQLAAVWFYVDSVGKTSDHYLVRPVSNVINPAVSLNAPVTVVTQVDGKVLQQPQFSQPPDPMDGTSNGNAIATNKTNKVYSVKSNTNTSGTIGTIPDTIELFTPMTGDGGSLSGGLEDRSLGNNVRLKPKPVA